MTTVVWDGVTLAADRKCIDTWGMKSEVCKIYKGPDWVIGAAGEHAQIVKWYNSVRREKFHNLPNIGDLIVYTDYKKDENDPAIILIARDRSVRVHSQGVFLKLQSFCPVDRYPRHAIGSGRDFALGALMTGEINAVQALEIAAHFDNHTNCKIDAFDTLRWESIDPSEATKMRYVV